MAVLSITAFTGEQPRLSKRLLPDTGAQVANNMRLSSGAIVPFAQESFVLDWPGMAVESVFRIEDANGNDVWLAWDKDVDAAFGPIADDELRRIYYTGDGEPRVTTTNLATSGVAPYPFASYVLGVYPPQNAPTLTPSGGSGTPETRAARYRLVSEWGEESALSPPVIATGNPNGTWTFGSLDPVPGNSYTATGGSWSAGIGTLTGVATTFGLRAGETLVLAGFTPAAWNGTWKVTEKAASTIKLAMASNPGAVSVVGTITRDAPHHTAGMVRRFFMTFGGVDEYFFIGDAPVATTSPAFVNPQVGEALSSVDYAMPPTDLTCLRAMSNGIMVGFSGKGVYFSEPFKPHAWPPEYSQTLDLMPVALEVSGTTVVIGTEGNPYSITGVDPATMGGGADKGKVAWPCLSKRGMVPSPWGVIYPSVEGWVIGNAGQFELIFPDKVTKKEMPQYNPSSLKAAMYGNAYVGFYETATGSRAVWIDRTESWGMVGLDIGASFPYVDARNGSMYFLRGDELFLFEGSAGERINFDFLSKEFVLGKPHTFNCGQVRFDKSMTEEEVDAAAAALAAALAANQALITGDDTDGAIGMAMIGEHGIGLDAIGDLPPGDWSSLTIQVIVNGVVRSSKTVTSEKPFRLSTNYRGDVIEIRLQGNVTVHAVHIATSFAELAQVQ